MYANRCINFHYVKGHKTKHNLCFNYIRMSLIQRVMTYIHTYSGTKDTLGVVLGACNAKYRPIDNFLMHC